MTASEQPGRHEAVGEVLSALGDLFGALAEAIPAIGSAPLKKIQPQLIQAKMLGQLAVAYSNHELKQRVEAFLATLAPDEPAMAAPSESSSPAAPFDGYDELTAASIVEALKTAGAATLDATIAYEAAHRNRSTVLNRARQLRGT